MKQIPKNVDRRRWFLVTFLVEGIGPTRIVGDWAKGENSLHAWKATKKREGEQHVRILKVYDRDFGATYDIKSGFIRKIEKEKAMRLPKKYSVTLSDGINNSPVEIEIKEDDFKIIQSAIMRICIKPDFTPNWTDLHLKIRPLKVTYDIETSDGEYYENFSKDDVAIKLESLLESDWVRIERMVE